MFYNRTLKGYNMPQRNLNAGYGFETYNTTKWELNRYDVPCADILELDDQFVLELALPGVVLGGRPAVAIRREFAGSSPPGCRLLFPPGDRRGRGAA